MKINIQPVDYTWHGVGGNYYNLIQNVAPRISKWLVDVYANSLTDSLENNEILANKLYRIAEIIDEEIDE